MRRFCLAAALLLGTLALRSSGPEFEFQEVAAQSGLKQVTVYGAEGSNTYLLETTGCGVAFLDFDNDGLQDVFQVNGSRLEGFPPGREPLSRLYRNLGDGSFRDVTSAAGVGRAGWGQAVCAGDYDNDGWTDFFVTYWGQNVLYRNRGDGTFEDVTAGSGLVQDRRRWNTGAAFLDYDLDGDLDLFVANYIDFDPAKTPTPDSGLCLYKGARVACGPPGLQGGKNLLYRNNGDGSFEDVSQSSGVTDAHGTYSLGVLTADFNNDGWVDVYVANDSSPSSLYINNQDGTLSDLGILSGCAYSQDGKVQAGMGVAAGDFNQDGNFDIFKTNFAGDTANLYRNIGEGLFEDRTFASGIGVNTRYLGWGCGFADFNNDGLLDLFQVNGHVYPEVETLESEARYRQPKIVYLNLGNEKFRDVSEQVGSAVLLPRAGRGAAFADYDNDGDMDVLVNNVNEPPSLYRNDLRADHRWAAVRLRGVQSNRSAIGARIRLQAGNLTLLEEVRSGGSYFSQNQLTVHFGLGRHNQIDRLQINWPGGKQEELRDLPVNRILTVEQGKGLVE